MHIDDFREVSLSRSLADLHAACRRMADRLDCQHYGLGLVTAVDGKEYQYNWADDVDADYKPLYDNPSWGRADPVTQHAKHNSYPIVWGEELYKAAGLEEKYSTQAAYGYKGGLMVASHLPLGKHVVVSFDRNAEFNDHSPDDLARQLALFQLFATYSIVACETLLDSGVNVKSVCELSPRELECLRWTLEGKTAWEIGMILSITERTAAAHLFNASTKLQTANKHQAVLKALRFGWIG